MVGSRLGYGRGGEEVQHPAWSSAAREQLRAASAALADVLAVYTQAVTSATGEEELRALKPAAEAMYNAVVGYEDAHAEYTGTWAPFEAFVLREGPPPDEDGVLIAVDREVVQVGATRCELKWARRYNTGIEFCMVLDFRSDRPVEPFPQPPEPGMRPRVYERPRDEEANWWIEVVLPDGRRGRSWVEYPDDHGEEREPGGLVADLDLFDSGGSQSRGGGKVSRESQIWVPLEEMPPSITLRTEWEDGGFGPAEIDLATN